MTETGTYILIIRAKERKEVTIGKMGAFFFQKGYYIYVGSAFGPGGLKARIGRHLRRTKKRHWHIDYLALEQTIIDVWFTNNSDKLECEWAKIFRSVQGLRCPVSGFGSSDCSCRSHLFYSMKKPLFSHYKNLLGDGIERWIAE